MKIDLDGSFRVAATPREAYDFLTDPERFAPLLPMFKTLNASGPDAFRVVLEVGVPQIRGQAEAQVRVVERVAGERAAFSSSVRHALGMADGSIAFSLTGIDGGSRIDWTTKTLVRGTLASVAAGLLSPLAKRNIAAMIAAVQKELGPLEPT